MSWEEDKAKFSDRIYPATITPFTADEELSEDALRKVLELNLAQGAKGGNMYPTGKKICPWYAATMAMAALRAGEGEKVVPLLKEAASSAGLWGEYWEINEPGVAEYRPWFMTAAGNCLYALNQMLLTEADGECRLAAGVPAAWKDYAFRLPAEGGYEVECAVKGGTLARLVLRARRSGAGRRVRVVLPDGTRRDVELH